MGKWIYKFGGKSFVDGTMTLSSSIERYDPSEDIWTVVSPVRISEDLKDTPIFLSNMGCTQINLNQILIYGGNNLESEPSSQCFLFEINDY